MKIRVKDLKFAYKNGKKVLDGINLKVKEGKTLSLVGPNGSGKTTLLKNLAGALKPSSGIVYLDMNKLSSLSASKLAEKMAVVEQEAKVGFNFTVKEIVQMGRIPHLRRFSSLGEQDKKSIKKAMRLTGIEDLADRSIREISGGEKQRVFLACALAQEPEVLLLDEPTSNLDINYQIEIMETVGDQVSGGLAVIMALHDLNLAAHYSHKIALLKDGVIMEVGSPNEVLTEDNIRTAFGTEVTVRKNPLTNSVYIDMPVKKRVATTGKKRLHVVCGGGSGIETLHKLSPSFQLSCGVLSPLDSDYNAAKQLSIKTVTEAPFSFVSSKSHKKNLKLMKESNYILVCETPFGEGNILNLRAVVKLADQKDIYLLRPETIEKRDYTVRKEATELIDKLLENGASPVHDLDSLIDKLLGR